MKPHRIQLKRTKGWRLPPNTVVVSRPSRWGNPYAVVNGDHQSAVNAYRKELEWYLSGKSLRNAVELRAKIEKLRGYNLACWCKLTDKDGNRVPCHADVLLELANKEER